MQSDAVGLMWEDACALLDRAERLQRRFFRRAGSALHGANWQPPIDVFETAAAVAVEVALPGVDEVQVIVDGGVLLVRGERPLPDIAHGGGIRRLEIPHGRFERPIELPPGHYELQRQELRNGCLRLLLRRLT